MVSEKSECQLKCAERSVEELKNEIEGSDVDFKNSKTKKEPKEYQLIFTSHPTLRSLVFEVRDSSATLVDMKTMKICDCP